MQLGLRLVVSLLALVQEPKPAPFEKEIEAFEAKDQAAPPPRGEIVFVGSSSIRFWKSTEAFPDLQIINRGFGGSQMSDSVRYAERIILPYAPRIVVVFAGGNDVNAKKSPEQVADDFKALVAKIHGALPKTKVYFISLFPNVQRRSQNPACAKVNDLIEAFTKTDSRLGYIDTASRMRAEDGGPRPELLRPDGLHMNDDGYKIWNEIVGALLRKP
ncbi:MAG TPA: GDSL-type esterase/lipase family protein [Planctomycetota bacterium]|nr:GDSL-type esterase/lipase family protein [Planctomycetota bacterium]